jgi:hypothetical protein
MRELRGHARWDFTCPYAVDVLLLLLLDDSSSTFSPKWTSSSDPVTPVEDIKPRPYIKDQ